MLEDLPAILAHFTQVDAEYHRWKGTGGCYFMAGFLQKKIGGTVVAGDYNYGTIDEPHWTRHFWLQRNGYVYDFNNVDSEKVQFYVVEVTDPRYWSNRPDSYFMVTPAELRSVVRNIADLSKSDYNNWFYRYSIINTRRKK